MSVKVTCPCCGGEGTISWGFPVAMPPMQQRIYEAVRFAKRPLSSSQIVNAIYGNRADGGPVWATKSIHVQIWNMNKRLAKVGEKISAGGSGHRESYRWERIDV